MQFTSSSAALYNVLTQAHHHAHHMSSALLVKRQAFRLLHTIFSVFAVHLPWRLLWLQFHHFSLRSISRYVVASSSPLLR